MSSQRSVTARGNELPLAGKEIKVGDKAPDFEVIDQDSRPRHLSDYAGKVLILSAVPSLDTSVCDAETRRFNTIAADLGENVRILTISMDLPTAQKRWCGAAGIDRVEVLSDHRDASFGQNYGVLIPAIRLLARCVFVVDAEGTVRHVQLVKQISDEPNYDEIIAVTKSLL